MAQRDTEDLEEHEAIVIGAGPAGLASAASLRDVGIETLTLERSSIGSSWRTHYDRLHLHTTRRMSSLPGLTIDRSEGRWVSRDGVVRYLEGYAIRRRLDVRQGVDVRRLVREANLWRLETSGGDLRARTVVIATGFNRDPVLPAWPERDPFIGELLHSSAYRNAARYRGKDVLVVGTGNSGAEIAVDLVEGCAGNVMISVRTPPNILRRDLLGVPSQAIGVMIRRLPARAVDRIAAAAQRLTVGDLTPYGMPAPTDGLGTRARLDRIPILDVGLIAMLKKRLVSVVPSVEGFDGPDVLLSGGARVAPAAVIAATGYGRGLEQLVGDLGLVGTSGRPVVHGDHTHPNAPNLYFIGFTNPISGNLREIGIDGRRIARAAANARRGPRGA
jgi:putative flavoprotein involved in K+ transport